MDLEMEDRSFIENVIIVRQLIEIRKYNLETHLEKPSSKPFFGVLWIIWDAGNI